MVDVVLLTGSRINLSPKKRQCPQDLHNSRIVHIACLDTRAHTCHEPKSVRLTTELLRLHGPSAGEIGLFISLKAPYPFVIGSFRFHQ